MSDPHPDPKASHPTDRPDGLGQAATADATNPSPDPPAPAKETPDPPVPPPPNSGGTHQDDGPREESRRSNQRAREDTASFDEEQLLEAESRRSSRVAGARTFGGAIGLDSLTGVRVRSADSVIGIGGTVAGGDINNITINSVGQATAYVERADGPLGDQRLHWMQRTLARSDSYTAYEGDLLDRFKTSRVVVLRGAEGSGRFTTAATVLDKLEVPVLVLDPETDPWSLGSGPGRADGDRAASQFTSEQGYILELTGVVARHRFRPDLLTRLEMRLSAHDRAFLFLLIDPAVSIEPQAAADHLVDHDPPAPEEVLKAHLRVEVPPEDEPHIQHLLDQKPILEELRDSQGQPGRVAKLARFLIQQGKDRWFTEQGALAEPILRNLRGQLEESVRSVLRAQAEPGADATTTRTGHRLTPERGKRPPASSLPYRAFLIACAVLDGFPLVTVTALAYRLAKLLQDVETPNDPLARPIFYDSVGNWLRAEGLKVTEVEGPTRPGQASTRHAKLPSALPEVVLAVVWREYDAAQQPMLEWLDQVVADTSLDIPVRLRAAQAVGKLATFDFEHVRSTFIEDWVAIGDGGRREAAAWTLEMASLDERLAPHVRRLVRRWSRSSSPAQRHAAVLSYGTGLGGAFPDEALDGLQAIARSTPSWSSQIAGSVEEIFVAGRTVEVLDALGRWVSPELSDGTGSLASGEPSARLRRLAARCLIRLAWRLTNRRDDRCPVLLTMANDDPGRWPTLVALWWTAWMEPVTALSAWMALRYWIELAVESPKLSEPLARLVEGATDREHEQIGRLRVGVGTRASVFDALAPFSDRLHFYLTLWSRQQSHLAPITNLLLSRLPEGGPTR